MGNEKDNSPDNQEIAPEAYAALKAELDTARAAIDRATNPLKERIALLEADVKAKNQEIARGKAMVEEKDRSLASLSQNFEGAISAYKGQVLKANPLIPPEMISGATIAEIDTALGKAITMVNKVKEGLAEDQQTITIPPGAPGRTPPDTSSMTASQKIKFGIANARKAKES